MSYNIVTTVTKKCNFYFSVLQVFLHHLNPLLSLKGFLPLWLTVLDLLRAYMHADNSENLYEAIPESLKNMLLVMASAGVLQPESYLWTPTWRAIDTFLPNLKNELFPQSAPKVPSPPPTSPSNSSSQSPTNQVTLNLADPQQGSYPKPIPPRQAPDEQSPQQQQWANSPVSQSPVSDTGITSTHLPTAQRLEEVSVQKPVTPVKVGPPSLLQDIKESQQVFTVTNQQPPSVSSPVAVQPTAHVFNSMVLEQHAEHQQAYQIDYKHQIGLESNNSPVKSQYVHLPQMQDFNTVAYTDSVKVTKQSEVSRHFKPKLFLLYLKKFYFSLFFH